MEHSQVSSLWTVWRRFVAGNAISDGGDDHGHAEVAPRTKARILPKARKQPVAVEEILLGKARVFIVNQDEVIGEEFA